MKLNNKEKTIFLVSLIILLILGITLTYNFEFKNNYNLLFDSDTSRVIKDATEILANHDRINVHPLFIILIQPLVFLLKGIVINKILSLVIISSFVSATSVLYIYKSLNLINKDDKVNILLTTIYLFSFSNIIFTSGIETYNFATLFLILLWYYFLKKLKINKFDKYSFTILIILGVLSLAFTITNFMVYLIILFVLWIAKKINIKQAILITIIPLILLLGLNTFQRLIWTNAPSILKTNVISEKNDYSSSIINKDSFKNVVVDDYYNSIISSNIRLKVDYRLTYNNMNYRLIFNKPSYLNFLLITIFYILLVILLIRNIKEKLIENLSLILILGFNTCLHLIYGNTGAFLYSLHFLYPIILIFGINLNMEKDITLKKYINNFLLIFLLLEVVINTKIYIKILNIVEDVLKANSFVNSLGIFKTVLIELIIIIIITLLIKLIRIFIRQEQIKDRKIINILSILSVIFIISSIFIALESANESNKFLFINLNSNSIEKEPKTKIEYLVKDFKKEFKEEISKVKEYEEEYRILRSTYEYETNTNLNWSDYYFFGFANRRKIFYKTDMLIDIDTNEVIYTFAEKEHLLVPNEYTVIIQTMDDEYIKIVEDNKGVHFIKNGKDEIIEGTEQEIKLYTFENEEYKNTKKVLYGEILFNIKDNKIYPNIIVYDDAWYRDAAIVGMALKQTNNLDLIKPWLESIDKIYDRQNSEVEETDNLGELLYLLSLSGSRNEELIDKIEEEANHLASNNPNGYYPYGKTDYSLQYLYQNLWYKLGIESVGRTYNFSLNDIEEDLYSSMTWWSDYNLKNDTKQDADIQFPYLSIATRHKRGEGIIALNDNLYPLSWEQNASNAKYDRYSTLENRFNNLKISPTHSWMASELLLFLLDETNNLK